MKISFCKYSLELKHQFTIAYSSRKTTPIVLIKIEHNGIAGYGEASLPPYLSETQESVIYFLTEVAKKKYQDICNLQNNLDEIDSIAPYNIAAKAAIDIALHDLTGKLNHLPCYKLFNIANEFLPFTSFTIGIDEPEIMRKKIGEAEQFKIIKVKLGREHDRDMIRLIRSETDKPLFVDVNQGWTDNQYALEMSHWLQEQNVLLIEQPFSKEDLKSSEWLSERSPIPIFADESVQRISDLENIQRAFNGINIKLMKCTGINEAYKMILKARELGFKIMLGCMTETSCAISAAIQLASLVDYADLDGNILIANDPFEARTVIDGQLQLSQKDGLGIELIKDLSFIDLC